MKKLFLFLSLGLFVLAGCNTPVAKDACGGCCKDSKDSMQVVLNIKRTILPEHVSAFKTSFEKCRESTLQEPGCLDYGMYQSYTDSTVFMIVETWANKGEHLKHMEFPHLKTHLEEIKGMGDTSAKGSFTEVYVCPMVNGK